MASRTDQAIMKQCVVDFTELLESNWDEIASMKDENEGRIKVAAAFLISFKGNEQAVKTTLSFGRMIKESRESIVNPDQIEMPFSESNGEHAAEPDAEEEKPKRRQRHATGIS
jgi:hypothetical protein